MSNEQKSIEDLFGKDKKEPSDEPTLNEKIEKLKLKEKEDIIERVAERRGISYINLAGFAVGPEALKLIPLEDCKKDLVVCFLLLEGNARVGAIDPEGEAAKKWADQIRKSYHARVELYQISENSLKETIKKYERLPKPQKSTDGISLETDEFDSLVANLSHLEDFSKLLKEASTSNLMNLVIASAVKMRASDIHFEPANGKFIVRFRIDGMLHDIVDLDKRQEKLVTSRVKLLSSMKINIFDRPQDGRFTIHLKDDRVDVRVSALPTNYGEALTLRLLVSSLAKLKLAELGFNKDALGAIGREIKKPNGMIVSTGPTGSGKTTTLYAIINTIKNPQSKIITIEDPIEYKMEGISQSQVNEKKEYTFSKGLKSLVRQDPDILMVGEMRDLATAEIAIQAALTGHLLLTTLHTNQATGAVARMMALGAKPFLLAPALNTLIGQRLVRVLCKYCKKEAPIEEKYKRRIDVALGDWPEKSSIKKPDMENLKYYIPEGCEKCHGFGYLGRIGIYEIVIVTDLFKDAITEGKTVEHELNAIARAHGTIGILQDGLLKASEGITSIEEVFRVIN